jgi:hypothetical protein
MLRVSMTFLLVLGLQMALGAHARVLKRGVWMLLVAISLAMLVPVHLRVSRPVPRLTAIARDKGLQSADLVGLVVDAPRVGLCAWMQHPCLLVSLGQRLRDRVGFFMRRVPFIMGMVQSSSSRYVTDLGPTVPVGVSPSSAGAIALSWVVALMIAPILVCIMLGVGMIKPDPLIPQTILHA